MHRDHLSEVARAAVAACHGGDLLRRALAGFSLRGRGAVLAVGKAATAMADAAVETLGIDRGLAITKDGHGGGFAPPGMEVRWAAHPVPDARSEAAADAALRFVKRLGPEDHLVVLLSGGTSSLLAAPVSPLTHGEIATTHAALLGAGLPIADVNAVRACIGRATGGRLAAACRAHVDVFVLSDVLSVTTDEGDPAWIGSGPFARVDGSRAGSVIEGVVGLPRRVREVVLRGIPPGAPAVPHHVIGDHQTLLEAAATTLERRGARVRRLDPSEAPLEDHADRLVGAAASLTPGEVVVTGGEPSVQLPASPGRGGRNLHLALELARRFDGDRGLAAAIVASDGTDGPTDLAGAVVDERSWASLATRGNPTTALATFDSGPLLERAGLALRTGPTGTNLLDLHLVARSVPPGRENERS